MQTDYTPGFHPGQMQFANDGDFTSFDPCGPPKISFPFKGDSVFSKNDVLFLAISPSTGLPIGTDYEPIPFGTFPNIQPWSNNQLAAVLEQEFMLAMIEYVPVPLNSPYRAGVWDIGWPGTLNNGQPIASLGDFILVESGDTEDMGSGLIKVKLRYATVPPTRNEVESFTYTFPALSNGRQSATRTVQSRVQYDYYVFDDFDILATPLFPNGNRLDATTGLYPPGLILQAQNYYSPVINAIDQNIYLPQDAALSDGDGTNPASVPSSNDWINWIGGINTSNTLPPELIAESSCMRRWMGNIWERRTRFVLAQ